MQFRRRILFTAIAAIGLGAALVSPASADTGLVAGDTAMVAYTGGEGVTLRTEPYGDAIAYLYEGQYLTIQEGIWAGDGSYWYIVSVDLDSGWTTGYVVSDYVASNAGGSTFVYEGEAAAADVPIIVNTGGGPLSMRSDPWSGSALLTSIPDGAWVGVLAPSVWDGEGIAWSRVSYAGMVGYAASAYLGYWTYYGDGGGAATRSELWVGSMAVVSGTGGDGVYMRWDVYGDPITVLPEGTFSEVIDGPLWDTDGMPWWRLSSDYGVGWVHGGYLATPTDAGFAAGGGGSGVALVSAAMNYIGTPYLWAGVTPNGFDCSGFTYYLMTSILGYDFPRPIEGQLDSGYYVAIGDLQPGDLIFFQNTYTWGISHLGIYIGDGQMISASGEHFAVGINNLNDPYWSTRYLTARRVL